ncbi:hypothetical protein BH23ACT9_BH23ACT9_32420 [soil metagenome]
MTDSGADPLISVVVVAFHRPELLTELLDHLCDPALEVLVVNVEADPHVTGVVATFHPLAVEITTDANVGYAAAVNRGVAAAHGAVVVFTNDDVVMGKTVVRRLGDALLAGSWSVVVPAVVNADGEHEATIMAPPTPVRLLLEWCCLPDAPVPLLAALPIHKWRRPRQAERIPAVSAVVVCTRRAILVEHPLPEAYFLYWEEAEWFFRLDLAGHVAAYHPGLHVVHRGGRADLRPEKSFLLAGNAVLCVRRTQGRAAALVALPIVVAWQLRLVVVESARLLLRRDRPACRRAWARLHGLRGALSAWRYVR